MSYKIYAGTQTDVGVWDTKAEIYNPAEENLRSVAKRLISPTLTREAGKAGSLEFTIPLGNVAHSALQKLRTIVEVEQDGHPLWRGRVMSHDMNFQLLQKVYCEGELAYLNDSALKPYKYTNISIKQFLSNVIDNHNSQTDKYKRFTLGNVTVMAELQEGFQVLYATNCYRVDNSNDDHDRYDLYDSGGHRLLRSENDFDYLNVGESLYFGDSTVLSITKTSAGSRYENAKYTAMLAFAYKKKTVYELGKSNGVYKLFDESKTWRVSEAGQIERYISSRWVAVEGELRDFDVSDNEALDFGDGKNFGVTWDILQSELTDVYGGYLVVRYSEDGKTRYLDYLSDDSITETNEQAVEFGVNMLDLDNYVKAENIVTRVIAVGYRTKGWWIFKSTSTIYSTANDTAAQKQYGIITRVIVVDGKSSTNQKLLDAANEELRKNLRYYDGIQVSAVDLRDAGYDVERLGWMKKTRIISKPHGIDAPLLLTKVVEPLDAPSKKKFTFGSSFYSISDLQALSSQKASYAYSMALSAAGYINGAASAASEIAEAATE